MALCIILIGVYYAIKGQNTSLEKYYPVFWLESVALWSFGVSWFVKGNTILKDTVIIEDMDAKK